MNSLDELKKQHDQLNQQRGTRSLTKQSFKDQCDINKIVAEFQATGIMPHTKNVINNIPPGTIPDYTNLPDYFTACSIVAEHNSNLELDLLLNEFPNINK